MIPQNWKQPKCPPKVEWINKVWCRHKTDYYTTMRMLQATTQMNHIMLNKSSKYKEHIKCNSITICSTVGICFMYCSICILYFTIKKKQSFSFKTLVSTHKILIFISVIAFISLYFYQTMNCLRVKTDFIHFGALRASWYIADAQQILTG